MSWRTSPPSSTDRGLQGKTVKNRFFSAARAAAEQITKEAAPGKFVDFCNLAHDILTDFVIIIHAVAAEYMQWYRSGHNEHDWKSCCRQKRHEGFKSLPLRQRNPGKRMLSGGCLPARQINHPHPANRQGGDALFGLFADGIVVGSSWTGAPPLAGSGAMRCGTAAGRTPGSPAGERSPPGDSSTRPDRRCRWNGRSGPGHRQ